MRLGWNARTGCFLRLAALGVRVSVAGMFRRLVVMHYHFRPGGVRSVISCGLAAAVERLGVSEVVMLSGEAAPDGWREEMERRMFPLRISWVVDVVLGYWAELGAGDRGRDPEEVLRGVVVPGTAFWVHNLSVGRHLRLSRALVKVVEATHAEAWLHQHDWWWDGRWERWPEFAEQGMGSLEAAVQATLLRHPRVHHVAINWEDAAFVNRMGLVACWCAGNPLLPPQVSAEDRDEARAWLWSLTSGQSAWLYPARALRRKNPCEALLLMNLVDPGNVLVTTGGVSSGAERPWWEWLCREAVERRWSLRAAVCERVGSPSVPALMAAAGTIVCPSLREGFGLPCWEAAVLERPLVARRLRQTLRTLEDAGVDLSGGYDALLVPADSFAADAEAVRTADGRIRLAALLPSEFRDMTGEVGRPGQGTAVDFGSLSAQAQSEVLAGPPDPVRRLNPWLAGAVRVPWRPDAGLMAPRRWAERFFGRLGTKDPGGMPEAAQREAAIREKVRGWLSQPLLWP